MFEIVRYVDLVVLWERAKNEFLGVILPSVWGEVVLEYYYGSQSGDDHLN